LREGAGGGGPSTATIAQAAPLTPTLPRKGGGGGIVRGRERI